MKNLWALVFGLAAMIIVVLLCACTEQSKLIVPDVNSLTKEIDSMDGTFSIRVPQDWAVDTADPQDYLILTAAGSESAYANVFFYGNEEAGDLTVNDFVEEYKNYYSENILGEVQTAAADGMQGYFFEYSMVDIGEDDNEYNYHGYEYLFARENGVVEIDIFYSQTKLESKLYKLSEAQLTLLKDIAMSIRAKDTANLAAPAFFSLSESACVYYPYIW